VTNEQLKIVIVGHVDHGKSTFVGRLFTTPARCRKASWSNSNKWPTPRRAFEWANLMDALASRARPETSPSTPRRFGSIPANAKYVIIDAPATRNF